MIEGEITIHVDGRTVVGGPGTFVNMPKGSTHDFRNETHQLVKMLILVAPGGMEQMFWETGAPIEAPQEPIPPLSAEEKARIGAAAPRYGIELRKP